MGDAAFDPDVINAIFKLIWNRRALEREKNDSNDSVEPEMGAGTSKRIRPTSANSNALKLSCELCEPLSQAVQRAATIAEIEGVDKVEATHLERILPQLLLDF